MKKGLNPFPKTPFWDRPKFKEGADDNWNVPIEGFKDTDCIENIVGKGEIAHFEQFHLFPQCFPKDRFFNLLKWVYMEERLNPFPHNDAFWRPGETSLLKTLREKEKLLVTSSFSFSHSVFYPFGQLSAIFVKFEIVVYKLLQFGRV